MEFSVLRSQFSARSCGAYQTVQHPTDLPNSQASVSRAGKPARRCSLDPVLELRGGSPSDEQDAQLIGGAPPAHRLRDIRANRVCGADRLHADGPLIERVPFADYLAQFVGERSGSSVDREVLES